MAVAEKKTLFEVNGFKVLEDSVYRVKHKVDYDAPSGFVKKGISKIPLTGDSFQAPFTGVNSMVNNSGRWDLGLHKTSAFYKFMSEEKVKEEKVNMVLKNVIRPYISTGINYTEEDFVKGNDTLFNGLSFSVKEEDVYDTTNPIHVFNLYVACLQRKLVPTGREADSMFSNASYCIENLSEKRTRTSVVSKNKLTASALFSQLLTTDITKIKDLMIYMGEPIAETSDEDILTEVFMERILSTPVKVDTFLANHENFSTTVGEIELRLYNYIKKAIKSADPKVSSVKGQIYYNDTMIGADVKSASRAIARAKAGDLKAIQKEILLGDEDN